MQSGLSFFSRIATHTHRSSADSGLGILQNLTGRLVSLEQYANGSYLIDTKPMPGLSLDNLNDLRRQRYTSVVDLNITSMLTCLPEFAGSRAQVRYARSITAEDLKNSRRDSSGFGAPQSMGLPLR